MEKERSLQIVNEHLEPLLPYWQVQRDSEQLLRAMLALSLAENKHPEHHLMIEGTIDLYIIFWFLEVVLYRPDVYKIENIIGYTGTDFNLASVYFGTKSGLFGHITQQHTCAQNIGRDRVISFSDYFLFNNLEFSTIYSSNGLNGHSPSDDQALTILRSTTDHHAKVATGKISTPLNAMAEYYLGKVRHGSRHTFVPIKKCSTIQRDTLALSIIKFQNIKPRLIGHI